MILESIHGAEDVKRLSLSEQKALAKELRRFILEKPPCMGAFGLQPGGGGAYHCSFS